MAEDDAPETTDRRAGDADVLALAEGLLTSLGETFDRANLEVLLTIAEGCPDAGRDGTGDVAANLAGLLGDFLASGAYDRDAIAVHVRAWRFMVSRRPDKKARLTIMSGLQDVRDHYGERTAA